MRSQVTTLCYIEREDSYLMLHRVKKKNDLNENKWVGIGGHAEEGESPEDCLLREAMEETGLLLTSYRFRGHVTLCRINGGRNTCVSIRRWFRRGTDGCDDGCLEWVPKSKFPT